MRGPRTGRGGQVAGNRSGDGDEDQGVTLSSAGSHGMNNLPGSGPAWTTGRDEPEVVNCPKRGRTPVQESTDQKVGVRVPPSAPLISQVDGPATIRPGRLLRLLALLALPVEAAASSRRSAYLSMSPGYRCPARFSAVKAHRLGCSRNRSTLAQARTLAFSRSNSSGVMTPRSRRSASLASWSAGLCEPSVSWT